MKPFINYYLWYILNFVVYTLVNDDYQITCMCTCMIYDVEQHAHI